MRCAIHLFHNAILVEPLAIWEETAFPAPSRKGQILGSPCVDGYKEGAAAWVLGAEGSILQGSINYNNYCTGLEERKGLMKGAGAIMAV